MPGSVCASTAALAVIAASHGSTSRIVDTLFIVAEYVANTAPAQVLIQRRRYTDTSGRASPFHACRSGKRLPLRVIAFTKIAAQSLHTALCGGNSATGIRIALILAGHFSGGIVCLSIWMPISVSTQTL